MAGNSLILAAIWKSPSLRAPRYILLGGWAFADLCTGLVSQPFYVAAEFICLEEPRKIQDKLTFLVFAKLIVASFGTNVLGVTVLLLTFMSIERWLLMTRRSLMSGHRAFLIIMVTLLFPIPIAVLRSFQVLSGIYRIISLLLFLFCCFLFSRRRLRILKFFELSAVISNKSKLLHRVKDDRQLTWQNIKKSV